MFFWISKLAWLVIAPDSLFLILLALACTMLWLGAWRPAKWLMAFALAVSLGLALFPVGEWILYPLEARFAAAPPLPEKLDGIIVLSGPEDVIRSAAWNQVEMGDGAERCLAFLALARKYPEAKLVFTGGSGSMLYQEVKGADIAEKLFQEVGLDLSRVVLERDSRNTYENAVLSMAKVKPGKGEKWVLITSACHMPRSIGIFRRVGWPVIAYPVDHRTTRGELLRLDWNLSAHLYDLNIGVREWVGLAAYYCMGKTTALLPPEHD